MHLEHLQPGDLFQFQRKNGPAIYRAEDGPTGKYSQAGQFFAGAPRPFCSIPDCARHPKTVSGHTDRPNRAVKKVKLGSDHEPLWNDTPEGIHKSLDIIAEYQVRLDAINAKFPKETA